MRKKGRIKGLPALTGGCLESGWAYVQVRDQKIIYLHSKSLLCSIMSFLSPLINN